MATNFDALPPAVPDNYPPVDPHAFDDEVSSIPPEGPLCGTCGKIIERKPGARGRAPKYHPECRPSAKKTGTRRKSSKPSGPNYQDGIDGIFQMVAFGLTMAGDKNEVFLADGLAVTEHGPNISAALHQLATEKPEVAAVLDRVLAVGPYGLVIGALAPLCMQIASNHGVSVPGFASAKNYIARFVADVPQVA